VVRGVGGFYVVAARREEGGLGRRQRHSAIAPKK
jgi:hypothetical protein